MTIETRITDALHDQAEQAAAPPELAQLAIYAGRRQRRMCAAVGSAVVALLLVSGSLLAARSGPRNDSLLVPASEPPATPTAEASPSPDPEASRIEQAQEAARLALQRAEDVRRRHQDLQVVAWLASLPLGAQPQVAWTYGTTFHSPTLTHTFRGAGWLVPLGAGGGGQVVEVHSEGDTGAGDLDKRTGVLTASGFRQIDHGNLTHALSADGEVLAASLFETDTATSSAGTGFDLYDTASGRRLHHVAYAYDGSGVVSASATVVRARVYHGDTDVLVEWDVRAGTVTELESADEHEPDPQRVGERPFTFAQGTLTELDGQKRTLRFEDLPALTVMDAAHEGTDAVLLVVGGQDTGDLGLLRCSFTTERCERATSLGSERRGDFFLDQSIT